jgi:hypothetical protein
VIILTQLFKSGNDGILASVGDVCRIQ